MLESVLPVPFWLEFAACLAGSISGAMSAIKARYDLFGTICISIVVGLLGGIIRDILLQNYGIYAFQKPSMIVLCAVVGIIVFYFGRLVGRLSKFLDPAFEFIDALTVGLWAIISVGKGLSAGLGIVPAVILGTITAVGGGIMRDVLMNRSITVFQAGTLYGSASLLGSIAFALMKTNHILDQVSPAICVGLVLALRYISEIFDVHTTPPRDYSDSVERFMAKPARAIAKKTKPTHEIQGTSYRRIKPVKQLEKTGRIPTPIEIKAKPKPRSTRHRQSEQSKPSQ